MRSQIQIRSSQESDRSFIIDSWCQSLNVSHSWRSVDVQKIIEDLFNTAEFAVACAADEPEQLYSWLCYEMQPRGTIFYCYTKQVYRRMGIAQQLLGHVFPEKGVLQVAFIPPGQSHFRELVKDYQKVVFNSFYLSARILCASRH